MNIHKKNVQKKKKNQGSISKGVVRKTRNHFSYFKVRGNCLKAVERARRAKWQKVLLPKDWKLWELGPIPCGSILDAEACLSPSVLRTALQLSGLCVTHQYGIA